VKRIINILFNVILENILKVLGIILVIVVLIQIFARAFMANPFLWTEEVSRFIFIWFCFLGSAYVLKKNAHLSIDYFYRKFSEKTQLYVDVFIQVVAIYFGYLLLHYGIMMMQLTTMQKSPVLRLQMSYMYAVLPVVGVLFIIAGVNEVILIIKNHKKEKKTC